MAIVHYYFGSGAVHLLGLNEPHRKDVLAIRAFKRARKGRAGGLEPNGQGRLHQNAGPRDQPNTHAPLASVLERIALKDHTAG